MKKIRLLFLCMIAVALTVCLCGCSCEHKNIKEEITVEPTCYDDGVKTRTCERCGESWESVIESDGHSFVSVGGWEETCTTEGRSYEECTRCGGKYERKIKPSHSFVNNECRHCGVVRSDLTPDTWYQLSSNNIVKAQNAEIQHATPMSYGEVYMLTYYPVCRICHITGIIQMTGVAVDIPVTETYYCESCKETTYVKFKLEY